MLKTPKFFQLLASSLGFRGGFCISCRTFVYLFSLYRISYLVRSAVLRAQFQGRGGPESHPLALDFGLAVVTFCQFGVP
jgi:hypothetical protein